MKRVYEKLVIIIEGELYGIRNVYFNVIWGVIVVVIFDWGVLILFLLGLEEIV